MFFDARIMINHVNRPRNSDLDRNLIYDFRMQYQVMLTRIDTVYCCVCDTIKVVLQLFQIVLILSTSLPRIVTQFMRAGPNLRYIDSLSGIDYCSLALMPNPTSKTQIWAYPKTSPQCLRLKYRTLFQSNIQHCAPVRLVYTLPVPQSSASN